MSESGFKIGIHYLPVRSAARMWREFDAGEIKEDLDRLSEWRLSPVRIFLFWEDFQPAKDQINLAMLKRLERLANWAAERNLSLWITFFVGRLHRANWLPGWMVKRAHQPAPFPTIVSGFPVPGMIKPFLSDKSVIQAQARLVKEVQAVLTAHPALFCYDLGKQPTSLVETEDPNAWKDWLDSLLEVVRTYDESVRVTAELQPEDFLSPNALPQLFNNKLDFFSLAASPNRSQLSRGITDPIFSLFLSELTRFLAKETPCWIGEVGIPTTRDAKPETSSTIPDKQRTRADVRVKEAQAEQFAYACLDRLRKNGVQGALWSCYADYWPSHLRTPPFDPFTAEAFLGVVRDDWSPKPTLKALQELNQSAIGSFPDSYWQKIEPEEYWQNPKRYFEELYNLFREQFLG